MIKIDRILSQRALRLALLAVILLSSPAEARRQRQNITPQVPQALEVGDDEKLAERHADTSARKAARQIESPRGGATISTLTNQMMQCLRRLCGFDNFEWVACLDFEDIKQEALEECGHIAAQASDRTLLDAEIEKRFAATRRNYCNGVYGRMNGDICEFEIGIGFMTHIQKNIKVRVGDTLACSDDGFGTKSGFRDNRQILRMQKQIATTAAGAAGQIATATGTAVAGRDSLWTATKAVGKTAGDAAFTGAADVMEPVIMLYGDKIAPSLFEGLGKGMLEKMGTIGAGCFLTRGGQARRFLAVANAGEVIDFDWIILAIMGLELDE